MNVARPVARRRLIGLRTPPIAPSLLVLVLVLASVTARGDDPNMPTPRSPVEALRTLRTKPGLRVELVAAEPLVASPVAIDFGADGKLWVCEMRDYPSGIDGKGTPGGGITVLDDRDGDGRYETATRFLEGLPFPTGVMAWRKGALICAAPEILYAEDTDGDGKADVREVLFRGFATENFQARVNGLSYGLDNWVYGANGLIGGRIHGTATGRDVDIGGRDFRIRPDTGAMEPASGLTQQGRVRDDWGNQFGGNNSILIQHYPLPDHYARRNPRVASPGPAVYVPQGSDTHRIYPASRTLERFNQPQSANRVTSACSPMIYRDRLLGDEYAGNAFICEPVHNLVHREVLSPAGVTFHGRRADDEQSSEFLASTDNWFRPVQVRTGPDGAIWVVDMYRFVVEHPRWISPQQLATLDVRAGADKGRIYRIVPEGRPLRPVPILDRRPTPELVSAMASPNGTLRDNVQRLLVHRGDRSVAPVLSDLAARGPTPECRMQALCTLEGLGALALGQVMAGLHDPQAGVRRQAVRLAEPWLGRDDGLTDALSALVSDQEITVRYQLALSLGEWDDPRAGEMLGRLARRDAGDPWVRGAILSSATKRPGPILAAVVGGEGDAPARSAMIGPLVRSALATRSPKEVAALVESLPKPEPGRPVPAWWLPLAAEILEAAPPAGARDSPSPFVRSLIARARALAGDEAAGLDDRQAAIRLLGDAPEALGDDVALLAGLLRPRNRPELQQAALRALVRLRVPEADARLIEAWPLLGPALRSSALDALLARPSSTEALVAALERRAIAPGEVDATHRQRLLTHGDGRLRGRAEAVFAAVRPKGRADVLAAYRAEVTRPGDRQRGKALFAKVCAACHRFDGQGHDVGPDLAALTDTSPEALLTAILDPNRDVDARYAAYTAALADGRVVSGLVAAETANAITLKRQEGQLEVVLRSDLDAIQTSGQSLMPEGIENDLKPADVADLIAYLSPAPARPKALEGNHPETVRQAEDGSIRLGAETAEVFGPTLTFEPRPGHLAHWRSADDRAAWSLHVDRPGRFTVAMEWSCADESAGNRFEVRVGGRVLPSTVDGTGPGGWSRYRAIFLGEVTLTPGDHRLELVPAGPVHQSLLNLRAITLTRGAVGSRR